jgi:MFS family permease
LAIGLTSFRIAALVTGTLLGSAALTLGVGIVAFRLDRRTLLLFAAALMAATGLGFAGLTAFWPLFVVAVVGTLNPSAGDVSVFLPTEQAVLAGAIAARDRTAAFAWYNLVGASGGALGALASAIPVAVARHFGFDPVLAERSGFVLYALIGLATAPIYGRLSSTARTATTASHAPRAPLARSRRIVLELSALFSLDSFGGGFVVQSMLALWLFRRFHFSVATAGAIFFVVGLLGAISQLVSARLAARIGLIETMVFTHLPSNAFLILAALMPTAPLAVAFLLLRALLSQMDVPARQSYVMAVVPPEERAAAASVTNVPRSLATALSPLLAGWLLDRSTFGWPLVCAGVCKAVYDVALLLRFRALRPADHE